MFSLPDLPFEYNALEPFIDEETMRVHHDGHHATYVKNLNDLLSGHDEFLSMDIENLLKSLDQIPEDIRTKVKNNAGGHYHHSFFWTILGKGKKESGRNGAQNVSDGPDSKFLEEIKNTFGSFDEFKEKFKTSALAVFGSGYTWLVLNNGKLEIINTPNQDSPISIALKPILTIDVWEHAYYLKYKNKRIEFIDAFWNIINWEIVQDYYNQAV